MVLPGNHPFWDHQCARKPCTREHPTHPCALPTPLKLFMAPEVEHTIETQGVLGWGVHSGTTSAHTKQSFWDHKCAHKSFTEKPGIQTSLTVAYQPTTSDGARVETCFLHLKRWQEGTSDTKKELYYQGSSHSGTTSAHTDLLPEEHQVHPSLTFTILPPTTDQPLMEPKFTNRKNASKGTGDTKTECRMTAKPNREP